MCVRCANPNNVVRAILWHQGEGDATGSVQPYATCMASLVKSLQARYTQTNWLGTGSKYTPPFIAGTLTPAALANPATWPMNDYLRYNVRGRPAASLWRTLVSVKDALSRLCARAHPVLSSSDRATTGACRAPAPPGGTPTPTRFDARGSFFRSLFA